MRDYYKILGVESSAGIREIRKAYRRLAKEKHPDTNPEVEPIHFVELNEAYTVIGDPFSKVKYDTLYDHYINGKPLSNNKKFNRRKDRRQNSVNRKAAKGTKRGEKRATESQDKFERKTNRWAFFDIVSVILHGFLDFISGFN